MSEPIKPKMTVLGGESVEEKLKLIQAGDEIIAEQKATLDELEARKSNLELECERLSTIVIQRSMDTDRLAQWQACFEAVAYMMRLYYGREIFNGKHAEKSLGELVVRYMNRERNLAMNTHWRWRLARWITKSVLNQTPPLCRAASVSKLKCGEEIANDDF